MRNRWNNKERLPTAWPVYREDWERVEEMRNAECETRSEERDIGARVAWTIAIVCAAAAVAIWLAR